MGEYDQFDANTFVIDSRRLDIEWEKQSALCFEACRLAAQAQLCLTDYKRQLEVKRAEVGTSVRRDPARYGFTTKPTEAAIEAQVTLMPEVCDLADKIAHAKYQYELSNAAVTALENKKKGLEALTQLRAMNYYSAK